MQTVDLKEIRLLSRSDLKQLGSYNLSIWSELKQFIKVGPTVLFSVYKLQN